MLHSQRLCPHSGDFPRSWGISREFLLAAAPTFLPQPFLLSVLCGHRRSHGGRVVCGAARGQLRRHSRARAAAPGGAARAPGGVGRQQNQGAAPPGAGSERAAARAAPRRARPPAVRRVRRQSERGVAAPRRARAVPRVLPHACSSWLIRRRPRRARRFMRPFFDTAPDC